jgi:hypothetical protein
MTGQTEDTCERMRGVSTKRVQHAAAPSSSGARSAPYTSRRSARCCPHLGARRRYRRRPRRARAFVLGLHRERKVVDDCVRRARKQVDDALRHALDAVAVHTARAAPLAYRFSRFHSCCARVELQPPTKRTFQQETGPAPARGKFCSDIHSLVWQYTGVAPFSAATRHPRSRSIIVDVLRP